MSSKETAAFVAISGRVMTADCKSNSRAQVTITDSNQDDFGKLSQAIVVNVEMYELNFIAI